MIAKNKLAATKASGIDKLPTKFKKNCSSDFFRITSIAAVFNVSLKNGTFPNDLKVAKVSPVFKTGDRKDRSNYRPISVLPFVSKIFEKLILIILQKVPHQSVMHWYKHMHKGDIDIAVFIDLKKAFDTVDHNILLNKLMRYGIKDND